MLRNKNIIFLLLSIPLIVLVFLASYFGIFIQETYAQEIANYALQGIGQDIINLFLIIPALVTSTILVYKNRKIGLILFSGIMFYLAYSYVTYCLGLHFNNLFLIYCAILSLSFYSLIYSANLLIKEHISKTPRRIVVRFTAIFFFILAGIFALLWLSEIIPSLINNTIPSSITDNGLINNSVYVLDLAFILPALVLTGIFLLKKKNNGYLFASALLTSCVMIFSAILSIMIVTLLSGVVETFSLIWMSVLTFVSLVLLIIFLKSTI